MGQPSEAPRIIGREDARLDGLERAGELRRAGNSICRVAPLAAVPRDLFGMQAEDEDIVGSDPVADLDIGAVEGSDRQGTIQRQLHVAGPRSFHPGSRDLLREIGGRNYDFGEADVVVWQEDDL